jgi:hypothetical protein
MFKRIIDVVASLATIAAALAILWVLFTDAGATRAWPWQKQRPVDKPATGYVRGDRMDPIAGIDYGASRRTLLIVYRSQCHFCIQSTPYYQQLGSLRDQSRAPVRIVAVGFEKDDGAAAFPAEQGWHPDHLALVPPSTIKVKGAPSVLLVDSSGTVVQSWLGQMTAENYTDVAKTVFPEASW